MTYCKTCKFYRVCKDSSASKEACEWYEDGGKKNRYSDDSACVCCGAEVPEGWQVCKKCENEKGD